MEWEYNFYKKYQDEICHQALLIMFEEDIRYIELREKDVVTFCKKCAFIEDKQNGKIK